METVLEIVKGILPACITGLVTFGVTKYNYHKDIPLDKLEITFNRVYYPIYYMIKYKNQKVTQLIEKCEVCFKKYNKYVDRSTMTAFNYLKSNPDNKNAYSNFKDNIYSINGKLRRRLGYLEPSMFGIYVYLEPSQKRLFRMCIEGMSICLFTEFILIFHYKPFQNVCMFIVIGLLVILILETIVSIVVKLYTKMKMFIANRKKEHSESISSNSVE